MKKTSTLREQYALTAFLILTPFIGLAIALFLPLPPEFIALLTLLTISTMAVLVTALAEGRQGVSDLLKKIFQWRISFKWYLIALLMPVGIILASGVLAFLLGWIPTVEIRVPTSSQLIFNLILIILIAVLEELGWRGYALPKLLRYRSPLTSALIIGIVAGLLHIGLGLVAGRPWLPTFLVPVGFSVIWTWLFLSTQGSLAMAMLFHFAIDYAPQFVLDAPLPIAQGLWAQAIVSLAVALGLILLFGTDLQRGPVKELAAADAAGR
ncbi:MAG: CPBP family intramembrane metalloprotease [Chloroflexi bacterium]|nr:MAG: CPBP family intramembrane metalloprotease [Chloroflexota bacterium]